MSLRSNFIYIRDWVNAKFLKKSEISSYYTKEEVDAYTNLLKSDVDSKLLTSVYQNDEDVIASALTELNERIISQKEDIKSIQDEDEKVIAIALSRLNDKISELTDGRKYKGGAILDLSGTNNPNYTVQTGQLGDEKVLNDDIVTAIENDEVFTIYANNNNGGVPQIFHIATATWNNTNTTKLFYGLEVTLDSTVQNYPYNNSCDYIYVDLETGVFGFGSGCD